MKTEGKNKTHYMKQSTINNSISKLRKDQCICEKYTNGTSLSKMIPFTSGDNDSTTNEYISVMSFNVLAPIYVRPLDKRTGGIQQFAAFEWISDEDTPDILDMYPKHNNDDRNKHNKTQCIGRAERLLRCLERCDADVICLQELQLERQEDSGEFIPPSWIRPLFTSSTMTATKYNYHLPPQDQLEIIANRNVRVLGIDSAVTCAILYRSDVLEVIPSTSKERDMETNTCVSIHLQKKSSRSTFVISSVHLDASDEKKRIGQLSKCLKMAKSLTTKRDNGCEIIQQYRIIIAGDMNQEFKRGSCVSAFLHHKETVHDSDLAREYAESYRMSSTQVPSKEQIEEWRQLYEETNRVVFDNCIDLDRLQTDCTRAAYDHGDDCNDGDTQPQMGKWRLDHMLYSSNSLQPMSQWYTLEDDSESCSIGLPNKRHGSDHIPIASVFKILPLTNLGPIERQKLVQKLQALSKEQSAAMIALQTDIDKQLVQLQQSLSLPIKDNNERPSNKATKKAMIMKPPKEVIEFKREKRSIIKELKLRQRQERQNVVSKLCSVDRLTIEQEFGYTPSIFVDKGCDF